MNFIVSDPIGIFRTLDGVQAGGQTGCSPADFRSIASQARICDMGKAASSPQTSATATSLHISHKHFDLKENCSDTITSPGASNLSVNKHKVSSNHALQCAITSGNFLL